MQEELDLLEVHARGLRLDMAAVLIGAASESVREELQLASHGAYSLPGRA